MTSTLADRVREILPIVREQAPDAERERKMPKKMLALLTENGFMRSLVPAYYGGDEVDLRDWIEATRLLSSADMSTGWFAGLTTCHTHGIAILDKRIQDDLWADGPDTVVVTAGRPYAKAEPVEGGVVLNGESRFSSGCDHADWAYTSFTMPNPRTGETERHTTFVPRKDFRVEDTWFIDGMKGTGSNTVVFENTFVPQYRICHTDLGDEVRGEEWHKNPMYRLSFRSVFNAPFSAFMIGGMEGALAIAQDAMANRARMTFGGTMAEQRPAQVRLMEARQDARAATLLLEKRWDDMNTVAHAGRRETMDEWRSWRADDAYAAIVATRVVETLMNMSGPSAHYESYPLQRFWRDLHVASQHPIMDRDSSYQNMARHIMGLPPDKTLLFSGG